MGNGGVLDFLALDARLIWCWMRLGHIRCAELFLFVCFVICNFSIIPRHQYDLLCLL